MTLLVVGAVVLAMGLAAIRWLRIAQREHYLAGSVTRFALRWWTAGPLAAAVAVAASAAAIVTVSWVPAGFVVAAVEASGPPGLGLRGRTSPLAWTGRLRRLAGMVGALVAVLAVLGVTVHPVVAVAGAVLLPGFIDLALAVTAPVEERLGKPWVTKAARTLQASGARVVAITGSYGKTSTKGYLAHLLGGRLRVVASPASFNNRMGLARAINENLAEGVDVFIAEMGTYGPGEIARLCEWIPPEIGVITAIGPVHLERFGTEDRIVTAKAEILATAAIAVLNVDDERLAAVADVEDGRRQVIRIGSAPPADVVVGQDGIVVGGARLGPLPPGVHAANLGCALGVVVGLGIDPADLARRLADLPEPPHRRTVATGESGVTIVDDTFNSNPAGAAAALATLAAVEAGGRRVVVTPGMVELGPRQAAENRVLGETAAAMADTLIVVGRTNRASLLEGAHAGTAEVVVVEDRDEAVAWVRSNLGVGDAVLYENDLPDHYP